jgi:predicted kinase
MAKKQKVYFLKGLPGSGKSTWAKKFQTEQARRGRVIKRINKDDLRSMIDNSVHSKEREKFILELRNSIMRTCLINGYDVIIDDTNFHPKHEEAIRNIVECDFKNVDFEIVDFTDVSLQTCIQRDAIRENSVGRAVIMDMYNRYLKQTPMEVQYDPSLPDCIICDVDGTLALHETRKAFDYWKAGEDRLNTPVADLVTDIQHHREEHYQKIHTIIVTGRENLCDEDGWTISDITQRWLGDNEIHFDDIYIRKQGDHRPDYEVKKEIYDTHIKGKYNVLYVIDDRKQVIDMWRTEGLTVLDVAGNEF